MIPEEVSGDPEPSGIPRPIEVLAAALGLILSLPVLAIAGLLIRGSSRGPILFRQQRVGRSGKPFDLFKLRTMRQDAGGPQVTARGDRRITPVGRALRMTKLDELPQLWNVVRGDMALVGPRPEVPRYVRMEDPLWKEVLRVRPGITDPVTLKLRDEESVLARAGRRPRALLPRRAAAGEVARIRGLLEETELADGCRRPLCNGTGGPVADAVRRRECRIGEDPPSRLRPWRRVDGR